MFLLKKVFAYLMALALTFMMSSCGFFSPASQSAMPEPKNTSQDFTTQDFNVMEPKMSELEPGFSTLQYDGDYGFDAFLTQGGASSDQEVLQFLHTFLFGDDARTRSGDVDSGVDANGDFFGCSTISVENTEGGYWFGRNFDWQNCDALVVMTQPESGYASISTVNLDFIRQGAGFLPGFLTDEMLTTAAIYAPLDGMNEKGLCVSVNMIEDGDAICQETEKMDVTTTTAIRLLLDRAATVEEALALLEQYDLHASMNLMVHFAIADASGRSVAVEYVDNEMVVIETPVLTNFYLAEGEKHGVGTRQSHTRFEILTEALEQNKAMTAEQVRDALEDVSRGEFGEFESTEWSVVYDQTELTAIYYHRENFQKTYRFSLET